MTFAEAKDTLKRMANGRYHVLYYSLTDCGDGRLLATCRVYVDSGLTSKERTNWTDALAEMDKLLNPAPVEPMTLEEAPQHDDAQPPAAPVPVIDKDANDLF